MLPRKGGGSAARLGARELGKSTRSENHVEKESPTGHSHAVFKQGFLRLRPDSLAAVHEHWEATRHSGISTRHRPKYVEIEGLRLTTEFSPEPVRKALQCVLCSGDVCSSRTRSAGPTESRRSCSSS
ncbi:hypothetical protein HPB50_028080 [Hyalomma asiaticum]|nr:hypothetical protein HPB50_028080 [Hyalomma asiaticum]